MVTMDFIKHSGLSKGSPKKKKKKRRRASRYSNYIWKYIYISAHPFDMGCIFWLLYYIWVRPSHIWMREHSPINYAYNRRHATRYVPYRKYSFAACATIHPLGDNTLQAPDLQIVRCKSSMRVDANHEEVVSYCAMVLQGKQLSAWISWQQSWA